MTITIRLPREDYDRVGEIATAEDRSLNYVLVHLIKQALAQQPHS